MYKVLFADDEPIALEGIRLMAEWDELGFEVCGMCANGEEALAVAVDCKPDLIITDIRMPVIDGLELIGRIQRLSESYNPIFIIMSGYGDFEYARSALRYGVRHYLLKPVMDEEWEIILKDIMQELADRAQEHNRQEQESYRLLAAVLAPILRGEMQEPDESVSGQIGELDRQAQAWRYIMIEGCKGENLECCAAYSSPPQVMFIDLMPHQAGLVADCALDVLALARRVYNGLRQKGMEVCVSVGPSVPSLLDLTASYSGAAEVSVYHFFNDDEGPVDYESTARFSVSYDLQAMTKAEELLAAAERLQEQEAAVIMKRLFASFQRHKTAPEVVRMLSMDVVLKSTEVLRELGASTADMWLRFRDLLQNGPKSLTGLEHSMRGYLDEYMNRLRKQKEFNSGHPLHGIERYIQENYKKPLTIKEIGERFYMNPVYLGQAFMKRNGVGITEYIHDLRIEEAKKMLTESDATIRSIAEEVGYVHYHHFLREFEKRVSEKPIVYRQTGKS
ncbi:response regulator [Paenibacillus sp. GCM10027628]|uniref:response regulator transcription factor n=1 Tax=Paenibacillus sp. GCM10027628 TaxID=3273413 RepID=UPI00363B7C38